MEKDIETILAINPGARYVGLAVFKDGDLREWKVGCLGRGSLDERKHNLQKMLSTICTRYGITTFVVKKLHLARSSDSLNALVRTARRVIRKQGSKLIELPLESVKTTLIPTGRLNKRRLMEQTAFHFPFLQRYIKPPSRRTYAHSMRMFEAVGLGLAYLIQCETNE